MWQNSCFQDGHNTVCGERELRGDRRGKGGRSLLATAASSFFIPLLCLGVGNEAASAQRISLHARTGFVMPARLLEDPVAVFSGVAGAPVDRDLAVQAAATPSLGGVVQLGFWPTAAVELAAAWAESDITISEEQGDRTAGTLTTLQGTIGARWMARPTIELAAAAGLVRHDGGDLGLFAGAETAGMAEARAGWVLPVLDGRFVAGASIQSFRFGTQGILEAGGAEGPVTRLTFLLTTRLFEVTR